ncbi:RNA cap guanine-N2 methyltransferase-domain-containing protein [Bombardia bombarda]|uniref:Trimethylguanosine synthase n=1 Tax=Bombardia bombarda TaxID=252184 RepID=A0AA39WMW3_9PEZI|nr:RNA cap guanine-N2 methyltransferase-domain-containing protein [Bombardia bombarda]
MPFKRLEDKLPLTDECRHYDDVADVPWDIQKYWHQRYSIFEFYDYDIRFTDEAWFGVTPEPIASKIANDLASKCSPSKTTLVDLFAGSGGNVIAFAMSERWSRIIAIEKDAATLACAQHNADVYGVREYITWVHGDSFEFLAHYNRGTPDSQGQQELLNNNDDDDDPALRINPADTTIFASPPWGGVSYRNHEVFDLSQMQPYNLDAIHEACKPYEHTLYLPRSSDIRQIAKLAPRADQRSTSCSTAWRARPRPWWLSCLLLLPVMMLLLQTLVTNQKRTKKNQPNTQVQACFETLSFLLTCTNNGQHGGFTMLPYHPLIYLF